MVTFREVVKAGVAPEGYHATSVFPEYFHLEPGRWELLRESRMDCVVVQRPDGSLEVVEFRRLRPGDRVAVGRGENAQEGIYVHAEAFQDMSGTGDKFAFRTRLTRETSFSIDYDEFYDLLSYERDHGTIVWVLGPAVVFDQDARSAFASLIRHRYVHALLAGNALATHDLEGALFGTALGQEIYSKRSVPLGHYHHLDAINRLREVGSIEEAIRRGMVTDGVMHAAVTQRIPVVLAGSIRDDGPLPGVIAERLRSPGPHAGSGAPRHHHRGPGHPAPRHRHGQHGPFLSRVGRRHGPPRLFLHGGHVRVRRAETSQPGVPHRPVHSHQRAGFRGHRGTRSAPAGKKVRRLFENAANRHSRASGSP